MNTTSSSNSSTSSRILDTVVFIYTFFLEPILALVYVWLMWKIGRSRLKELHSSFYRFFIFTGIAACLNVFVVVSKRAADRFMPDIGIKGLIFNFIMFASHWFSLSHTTGKILGVASRFTVICFPLAQTDFWSPRRVRIAAILMFTVPAVLNCFVVPMEAKYRIDDKGNDIHAGVANWAMQTIKYFANTGYVLFLILTTPMCAISIYKLRQAQRFNKDLAKQERALLIHTVITTTAHMLKSVQQIVSLISLISGNTVLYATATNLYNIPNALTTFVPPILLIITSTPVRNEISCGLIRRVGSHSNVTIATSQTERPTLETTI